LEVKSIEVIEIKIKLEEIGPRDGFQNVKEFIPTDIKLKIIDGIVSAGYKKIEITSLVSPKAIPQMRDAQEVIKSCLKRYPDVELFALVPNLYGARTAVELGLKEVCPVISLSETHNKANVNKTVEESLRQIKEIKETFPKLKLTIDIATAFACPFEGEMKLEDLIALIQKLYDMGIRSFMLCDTIGKAYPKQVEKVFRTVKSEFKDCTFGAHIHDTRNMGILNTYIAIENGADSIQTSLGGLGGCPFAPGASGNTSSEDLVYALNQDGYDTGIDFDKLLEVAKYEKSVIEGNYSGHHINIESDICKR
jgi:hydroxymethylglutaryl-CoA lyase